MPKVAAQTVVRTSGAFKDPTTKYNLLDRIMAQDFSGDIRDLAINRDLKIERSRPNVLKLRFGVSGKEFELSVRKPRGPMTEAQLAKRNAKLAKKTARRRAPAEHGEGAGEQPQAGATH